DKVDAEIPAPASGTLQDIKVAEGATVQVNTVVGTISADGEAAAPKAASASATEQAIAPTKDATPAKPTAPIVQHKPAPQLPQEQEEEDHTRSSPLVRKIAREHNVNLRSEEHTSELQSPYDL